MYKETEEDYKKSILFSTFGEMIFQICQTHLLLQQNMIHYEMREKKYARCLKKAGNRVEAYRMKDALHGYFCIKHKIRISTGNL